MQILFIHWEKIRIDLLDVNYFFLIIFLGFLFTFVCLEVSNICIINSVNIPFYVSGFIVIIRGPGLF